MNDNTARHHPRDDYDRGLEPARPVNDPLAELARLIGQNDPFAHIRPNAHAAAPRDVRHDDSPFAEWEADGDQEAAASHDVPYIAPRDAQYDAHTPSHSIAPEAQYEADDYVAEPQTYAERDDAGYSHVPLSPPVADADAAVFHRDEVVTADDAPPTAAAHLDPAPVPPADEFYDDAPQRGGLGVVTMVLGAVGLVAVGVGAAFAYRTYVSNLTLPAVPPIIRATSEPTKVVPPPPKNDTATKLSYDRFGDRSQNEQMVVREEKPVDPKNLVTATPAAPPASSVFPPVVTPGAPSAAPPAAEAPQASANPPSVLTEPKRVRTVPVLPEQTKAPGATSQQLVAPAPAPPPQPATTASTPTNVAPPAAARPQPPAAAPPRAPAQTAAPARTAHTPLSLAPNGTKAPAAPSRSVRAAAPMPLASATAPASRTRGYLVQVASQRSEADAQTSFRSIRSKYSGVLGNREAVIRKADLGSKGVYYRAMVGPFPTRDQAVQLCASLKAAGGSCVIQGN